MAAGQVTADKMAIGLGGNLLYNPIFANNGYGWNTFFNNNATGTHIAHQRSDTWGNLCYLPNENIFTGSFNVSNASIANGARVGGVYINVPVIAGKWYMLSCYVGCHRGVIRVSPEFRTANGGWVGIKYSKTSNAGFTGGLKGAERIYVLAQAPNDAISVDFFISVYKTENTSNLAWFAQRPMLEECTEHTREPSPWQNAGVTAIHGGSIVTNSITTQQMAANSITANEIAAGAVAARHIAVGSIGADHIATRSLTADKLNVSQLSAVSANMGDINGGSLNINNRFKVSRDGQVEMRAATGKVGMVVNNDSIIVYDERGNVRVKIGKL